MHLITDTAQDAASLAGQLLAQLEQLDKNEGKTNFQGTSPTKQSLQEEYFKYLSDKLYYSPFEIKENKIQIETLSFIDFETARFRQIQSPSNVLSDSNKGLKYATIEEWTCKRLD